MDNQKPKPTRYYAACEKCDRITEFIVDESKIMYGVWGFCNNPECLYVITLVESPAADFGFMVRARYFNYGVLENVFHIYNVS